jgi:hypothetical protein
MKITKHRDGTVSMTITAEQSDELWALVREGRHVLTRLYANYDSDLALELLRRLPVRDAAYRSAHIDRAGDDYRYGLPSN